MSHKATPNPGRLQYRQRFLEGVPDVIPAEQQLANLVDPEIPG